MSKKLVNSKVSKFLFTLPSCRDNDRRLLMNVWAEDMAKANINPEEFRPFLELLKNGTLTNPESVRRTRQSLQQHFPVLRGPNYGKRKQEEPVWIEELQAQ